MSRILSTSPNHFVGANKTIELMKYDFVEDFDYFVASPQFGDGFDT